MDIIKKSKIINRLASRKTDVAVIHSIDIDRVNIIIGKSSTLIRNVEVLGDPPRPGTTVKIIWAENRPVVVV